MNASDNPPRRRPRLRFRRWLTFGGGAALAIALLALASQVPFSSETLRQRVVATLSERLDSEVELSGLHLRVFPRFHAEGFGLTIRHKRRHDVPPLIAVRTLSVDADLIGLLRKHVAQVTLYGLEIDIPPGHGGEEAAGETGGAGKEKRQDKNEDVRDVVIDNLVSTDARLVVIPSKKDKPPRVWAIHALRMRTVAFTRAMPFEATLTNAIPPGEIGTKGVFGPWQAEDPGATPVDGTFTFAHADLSVFKGISGTLSAHGEFGGSLRRIGIHGETDTPDFTVAISGHPVPLHADYHATVDGTNGDTLLDRIDGRFLKTSLVAKGKVVDGPGNQGHTVTLDIALNDARIEDVLRLAVKAPKPPMTGALKLTTKFVLPPGRRDVVEKLRLDGQFAIATARFTSLDIQKRVDELSHRSRGKARDVEQQSVASNFDGRFTLGDGTLGLASLTFDVPGAGVRLAGAFDLRSETLDFRGTLLLDAKVSETQSGLKRVLLKAIDPLFKRDGGGSAIPIKIVGTRSDPSFGLDTGRVLKRGR